MNSLSAKRLMNELGESKRAFYFVIDYKMQDCLVYPGSLPEGVKMSIKDSCTHIQQKKEKQTEGTFACSPVSFECYQLAYEKVRHQLMIGNSYLCNLTFQTPIETSYRLEEIFDSSEAPYKLLYKDKFVVFSPETFVRIQDGCIYSYPMKGTIDASLPNAEQQILNDEKEMAEHATITDLIRNDLSIVSKNVRVTRYRYLDLIRTNGKDLLQVSSEITGELPEDYHSHIGDILFALLPAGSICGAPKPKTLDIILASENYDRGFYTGIFGYFDGDKLESAVSIRFIENQQGELVYKSGGGITTMSDCKSEYQELIDKIYVPFY